MKHLIKTILFILLSSPGGATLIAQTSWPAQIDSMNVLLSQAKEDTNKVWLLCELSNACLRSGSPDLIKYAQMAHSLAEQLKWQKGITRACGCLGWAYSGQKNYTEALKWFLSMLTKARETNDQQRVASAYFAVVITYMAQKDFVNAIEFCENALKTETDKGNKAAVANIYRLTAGIYSNLNEYRKSIGYMLRALDMLGTSDKPDPGMQSELLSNIAVQYQRIKEYDKSLEYSFAGMQKAKDIGDKWVETNMNGNLALVYTQMKKFSLSIAYAHRSLEMAEGMKDTNLVATAQWEIGNALLLMAKDTMAADNHTKPGYNMENGALINDSFIPATRPARLRLAVNYLHQALSIKEKIEDEAVLQYLYSDLADAHTLNGDYKAALEYHLMYTILRDSAASKEHEMDMERSIMQRDFEKQKIAAKAEQEKENAVAAKELQKQKVVRNAFISGFVVVLLFAGVFFSQRNKIKMGKKQSDELLLNILPAEVAEELKTKGNAEAKLIDQVTVLFTDFKGFTQLSEKLSPKALVAEINECFSAFDLIMQQHGVEKIKTIGDSYMAAGGLPTPNKTHPEDVVRAALEIQQFMQAHKLKKTAAGELYFEIRIGVHTGPVVAGIVGVKKFQYDIWGDTVNTASRMESSGGVGRVNISETTYELVKDKFNCEYRGEIDAKGKGAMKMYYVS